MAIEKYLTTKDYSVSKEKFTLLLDDRIDLLITDPRPKKEELGKYYEFEEYISHTDSKKGIVDTLYQTVKKSALQKKLELLNSVNSQEKTVLDIGCGTGDFLSVCENDGWKVTGIEPSEKARKLAKQKLKSETYIYTDIHAFFEEEYAGEEKDFDIKQSYKNTKLWHHGEHPVKNVEESIQQAKGESVNDLEENPYQYDVITMWHVLEHIYDLDKYIYQLKKLLKPNGTLIIAVPNFKSWDAEYYKEYWAAYDTPRHLWHFSQTAIHRLFSTELMKVVKTIPMKFDAFYVSILSEKYKSGKNKSNILGLVKAFFNGLKSNRNAKKTGEYSSLIYVIKNMD